MLMKNIKSIDGDEDPKELIARTRLFRPFIIEENKVTLNDIKDRIDQNYNEHSKWTIIRDIEGHCINDFLSFSSVVLNMDELTDFNCTKYKHAIKNAMEKGQWVTLSFSETI